MTAMQSSIKTVFTHPFFPWLVALFFHCIGAYYSVGYHHPDEHYQIWEWANYFAGLNPHALGMRWEFTAEIRPWFQPMLHAGLIKFFLWIGKYNPFTTAFIAREVYALVNLIALYCLGRTLQARFANLLDKKTSLIFAWTTATLWFFPYIHCRTSSENLSGIFLTFAFAWIMRPGFFNIKSFSSAFLGAGFLLGLAFLARYQIALGLVGLGVYLLWKDKKICGSHLALLSGFLVAAAAGVVMDRIGYGHWVFTPYQYFNVNLVKGVAATYSPYPWYQYFVWLLQLNAFVTIPIFYGIYQYVKKEKLDPMIAFTAAFCFLQFFITNKEYRFLFPVFNFIPFFIAYGWHTLWPKSWALVNIPGIIASSFRATSWTLWPLFAFHHYFQPEQGLAQRWLTNHGSFDTQYYQMPETFKFESFVMLDDLKPTYEKMQKPLWLLWDDHPTNPTFEAVYGYLDQKCERVTTSIPQFVFDLREKIPAVRRLPYQAVYICNKD